MPEPKVQKESSILDKYIQKAERNRSRKGRKWIFFWGAVLVLIVGVAAVGSFFYGKMEDAWDEQSSWYVENLPLPEGYEKYRVSQKTDGNTLTIDVDYCGLYRVETPPESNLATFYCAFLPLEDLLDKKTLDGTNHLLKGIDLKKQSLILTIDTEQQGKLREQRERDYFGDGFFEPVYANVPSPQPVQFSLTYDVTYPEKTLMALYNHYVITQKGEKEQLGAALSKWSIGKIATSSEGLSDDEKLAYYKEWADKVWADVNKDAKKSNTYGITAFENFVESISRTVERCDYSTGESYCSYFTADEFFTNFLHYLYTASYRDPESFRSLSEYVMQRYYPFVDKNENGSNVLPMGAYPLCPIAEVANNKFANENVISFFMKLYIDKKLSLVYEGENFTDLRCYHYIDKKEAPGKMFITSKPANKDSISPIAELVTYDRSALVQRFFPHLAIVELQKDVNEEVALPDPTKEAYLENDFFSEFLRNQYWHPYARAYVADYDRDIVTYDIRKSLTMMYDITVFMQEE